MIDQIITPLPEVVDRYTICQLKLERLDHTQIDVDSMKEQLEYYKKGIDFTNTQLIKLSEDLYNINVSIAKKTYLTYKINHSGRSAAW